MTVYILSQWILWIMRGNTQGGGGGGGAIHARSCFFFFSGQKKKCVGSPPPPPPFSASKHFVTPNQTPWRHNRFEYL